MKPFLGCFVGCVTLAGAAFAQSDYAASIPPASPASASAANSGIKAPRTGLYGGVMKGNAAVDNTIDDFTKRPHLIEQQYLAGWGAADLVNAGFAFEAIGFNWFGAGYGGADPDEVRFGLAKAGSFGGGLMLSLAKSSTEDSVAGVLVKTKNVLESDGFGAFGSYLLGSAGDVYGEIAAYTGWDTLWQGPENYSKSEAGGATVEETPRIIHILAGWKRDASSEGTHSLNAELILDIHSLENKTPAATTKRKMMEIQAWFYHGYILKDNGGFKVFLGSNTHLRYRDVTWETAPTDRSALFLETTPNMSLQKSLPKGLEGFAGASVTLGYVRRTNTPQAAANPDKYSSLTTVGTDMALGLRWAYENIAVEGSLKESVLANGPQFIGGTANQGLFGQLGVSVGF